ncbi:MAG: UDP-2,3-diacylglucosamine diphosphatase [Flavobacteriales bacterium]|nr:UDP-2,3-diacylglucosamine diphosphatase [Flavobacteriales bacterium]MCB9447184.1 UDP-2,3-diacylglucosamine diphosphatase [Flavobacteriales bacterium]
MPETGNIFFISDLHLGVPDHAGSLEREKKVVAWLDAIKSNCKTLYLLGDVFDFWFEYKTAVPRGFVRLLGKLAELRDAGTQIHFFTGNHDMWAFDYLEKEIGVIIHRHPVQVEMGGKKFYLAHGDGIGPGDHKYKMLKKIFASKLCQWLFARLHPNLGIGIAQYFSRRSRLSTEDEVFYGDKEWQVIHSREVLKKEHIDYFIYGHRHLANDIELENGARFINLGDWISLYTYAEFNGSELVLKKFNP